MDNRLNYIDIFSGCGGLSLGLYKAGWKGLFAIEKSPMAFETLKYNLIEKKNHFNWPEWLPQKHHDINRIIKEFRGELQALNGIVSLVTGGPPCQGFSFAGRRKAGDKRNKLVDSYIEFIKLINPRIIFFENVKGFTVGFKKKKSRGKAYSDYVIEKLASIGYDVEARIIDFSEFGVPQRRKRFILVGIKDGNAKLFFEKLVFNKATFLKKRGINQRVTSSEAISDLEKRNGEILSETFKGFKEGVYSEPMSMYQELMRKDYENQLPDSHRFPNHQENTIQKFKHILETCKRNTSISSNVKDKFNLKKRSIIPLDENEASPTLTTLPDDYIHYSEPRILTVREYARMQTFDDWFEFKGKYTTGGKLRRKEVPRYTQVGNAIPPLFGEQSGIILMELVQNG